MKKLQGPQRTEECVRLRQMGYSIRMIASMPYIKVSQARVQQILEKYEDRQGVRVEVPKIITMYKKECGNKYCNQFIREKRTKFRLTDYCSKECRKIGKSRVDEFGVMTCNKCKERKHCTEFYAIPGYCKKCHDNLTRDWARRHPEKKRKVDKLAVLRYQKKQRESGRCVDCSVKIKGINPKTKKLYWHCATCRRKKRELARVRYRKKVEGFDKIEKSD